MRIIDTLRDKMADALAVNPIARTYEESLQRYNNGSFDLYDSDVAYSAVQWVANQASRVIIEAPETSMRLLEAPVQMESARLLINSLVTDCSIMGTTYVHIETDDTGRATGLRWVPDSCMNRKPSRNFNFYTYYLDGRRVDVLPDRMMVIRQNVSPSRYREGLGLKHVLLDTVYVDWYTERYLADILPTMPAPYVGLDVSQFKSAQGEKVFEGIADRIATKLRPRRSSSNPVTVVENADTKIVSPVLGDYVDTGVNLRAEERVCAFLENQPCRSWLLFRQQAIPRGSRHTRARKAVVADRRYPEDRNGPERPQSLPGTAHQ